MAKTRFVAKAIVFDSAGNFLRLVRGDNHPVLGGFYDIPGGMIEAGEEPGEALIREITEETGLKIAFDQLQILYATTMLLMERSYPTLLYKIQLSESQPSVKLSYEHKDYKWAPISDLYKIEPQLAPTYREALRYLQDNNILEDS